MNWYACLSYVTKSCVIKIKRRTSCSPQKSILQIIGYFVRTILIFICSTANSFLFTSKFLFHENCYLSFCKQQATLNFHSAKQVLRSQRSFRAELTDARRKAGMEITVWMTVVAMSVIVITLILIKALLTNRSNTNHSVNCLFDKARKSAADNSTFVRFMAVCDQNLPEIFTRPNESWSKVNSVEHFRDGKVSYLIILLHYKLRYDTVVWVD